jgi:hypothetical protein
MARKTKAELQAEAEAWAAATLATEQAEYPARLMAALELATRTNNYELSVENGMFALRDRDQRRPEAVMLTTSYTLDNHTALDELEWSMRVKAEEREEATRQRQAREAALAKLTEEERKLLGL